MLCLAVVMLMLFERTQGEGQTAFGVGATGPATFHTGQSAEINTNINMDTSPLQLEQGQTNVHSDTRFAGDHSQRPEGHEETTEGNQTESHRVHLVDVKFEEVESPFIVCCVVLIAALSKLGE